MTSFLRVAAFSLLLGLAMPVLAEVPSAAVPAEKQKDPLIRDTFADVGGYRLHFRIVDGRSPAIVLESGGGADASQWSTLQLQLARATGSAVVSYDRAGFGDTDLPRTAYDAAQEVDGLHKGLQHAGLASEVVLVGHSYGGMLNQLYANQFPQSVKGIVLVDPNTVAFVDAIGGPGEFMVVPFDTTPPLSKTAQAGVRQILAFDKTVEAVRKASIPKAIPVTVITAGKPWWPTPERSKAYRGGHEAIVAEALGRSLIVAEGSAHNIPRERPDLVVSAVEAMIARSKTSQ